VALHALPAREAKVETMLVRRRDGFVSTALMRFIETAQKISEVEKPRKAAAMRGKQQAPRSARRRRRG
jgi:hypothetical protein